MHYTAHHRLSIHRIRSILRGLKPPDFRSALTRLPDPDDGFLALSCGEWAASVQAGAFFASHPREDLSDPFAYEEWEVAVFSNDDARDFATRSSEPWLFFPEHPWNQYVDSRTEAFYLRYAPTRVVQLLLDALVALSR